MSTPFVVDVDERSVVHQDALRIWVGGEVVGTVTATYDLSRVPPEHFWQAVNLVRSGHPPIRLVLPTHAETRALSRYYRELDEWRGLSWWRRLFTPPPTRP